MDILATIIKNTIHVNSEEFQNFITLKNLEPKEDVKSETNTEMSTINSEDITDTPSTSSYSVKIQEDMVTSSVLITKPVKRGCGGSSVPKTAIVEPPRGPCGRPPNGQILDNVDSYVMDNSSAMSSSEQKEHRNQRRLKSNNAAFQRYQNNCKRKLETQDANLKKRKTGQVKTCPEVTSTTFGNLEPKEDVESKTNTEMSTINYEDIPKMILQF